MLARFVFVLALFATSPAWAQTYLGGNLGTTSYPDGSDIGVRFFGGYAFTPHMAAEIGFGTLGTVRSRPGQAADLAMADLSLIASAPIGNRFSLHGRLGAYYGAMQVRGTVAADNTVPCPIPPPGVAVPPCPPPPAERGLQSGYNTDLTYGLGLSYAMTETGTLRVEWQRFQNFGGDNGAKLDVDLVSIGVLVHIQ